MREIKFRVWDSGYKVMTYPYHINNGRTDKYLMQYTGIHDLHNIEIYEGDLVRMDYPAGYSIYEIRFGFYDNGREYEDVVMGNGWYAVELWAYSHYVEPAKQEIYSFDINGYPFREPFEVIGNIFENAELLVGGKQ